VAEVPGILKRTWRVVFIQVGTVHGGSEMLALYSYGAYCDFAIFHLNGAARFLEKRSILAVGLYAP
jgi:hypothetical protein